MLRPLLVAIIVSLAMPTTVASADTPSIVRLRTSKQPAKPTSKTVRPAKRSSQARKAKRTSAAKLAKKKKATKKSRRPIAPVKRPMP